MDSDKTTLELPEERSAKRLRSANPETPDATMLEADTKQKATATETDTNTKPPANDNAIMHDDKDDNELHVFQDSQQLLDLQEQRDNNDNNNSNAPPCQ